MTTFLYDKYKEKMLKGSAPDLDTLVIKAVLVSSGTETPVPATDEFISDVTIYVGVTAQTLTSTTVAAGVFDAGNVLTFTAVDLDTGNDVTGIVLYEDTAGAATTDPLIAHIDNFTAVTPNGGNITVTWGANIFALT